MTAPGIWQHPIEIMYGGWGGGGYLWATGSLSANIFETKLMFFFFFLTSHSIYPWMVARASSPSTMALLLNIKNSTRKIVSVPL